MSYPTELIAKAKYELGIFDRVAAETGSELVAEVERLREILQRAKPTVAWMTEDGRVAHTSTKECMPGVSQEAYCIPLCVNK